MDYSVHIDEYNYCMFNLSVTLYPYLFIKEDEMKYELYCVYKDTEN